MSHNGYSVTFDFEQNLKSVAEMLSVHYYTTESETECVISYNVSGGGTNTKYTAHCVDGSTAVGIYIYVGENFVMENFEACAEAPKESQDDIVAYYFELPCNAAECDSAPAATGRTVATDCYSHCLAVCSPSSED
jgi:hypothetical protein